MVGSQAMVNLLQHRLVAKHSTQSQFLCDYNRWHLGRRADRGRGYGSQNGPKNSQKRR